MGTGQMGVAQAVAAQVRCSCIPGEGKPRLHPLALQHGNLRQTEKGRQAALCPWRGGLGGTRGWHYLAV